MGHSSDKLTLNMLTQPHDFKTEDGSHILNQKVNGGLYLKPSLGTGLAMTVNQAEVFAAICRCNKSSGCSCFHSKFIYLAFNMGTDKTDLLIAT